MEKSTHANADTLDPPPTQPPGSHTLTDEPTAASAGCLNSDEPMAMIMALPMEEPS